MKFPNYNTAQAQQSKHHQKVFFVFFFNSSLSSSISTSYLSGLFDYTKSALVYFPKSFSVLISKKKHNDDDGWKKKFSFFASLFQQFSHEKRIIQKKKHWKHDRWDEDASLKKTTLRAQQKVAREKREKKEENRLMNACVALARKHFILIKCWRHFVALWNIVVCFCNQNNTENVEYSKN